MLKKIFAAILIFTICAAVLNPFAAFANENDYMTREEFIFYVMFNYYDNESAHGVSLPFADWENITAEYYPAISAAHLRGMIDGFEINGERFFLPQELIARQHAFSFLAWVFADLSEDEIDVDELAAWFANEFGGGEYFTRTENFVISHLNVIENAALVRGDVTTFVGSGDRGFVNGDATAARFLLPRGVVAVRGDLIIFDTHNNAIRQMRADEITTIFGEEGEPDERRFPRGSENLNRPFSGVVNSRGEIIFTDSANNALRIICENLQTLSTFETQIEFNMPTAIAIDDNDNLYVADTLNNRILRITPSGEAEILAGAGEEGYRNGAAANALFRAPMGIAVSGDGSVVYVSDTSNHRIRRISNGMVTTVAGTTVITDDDGDPVGGFANGAASNAMFNSPMGITLANDAIVIADSTNNMLRIIRDGVVTTLAGTGNPGDTDGNAFFAEFNSPSGVFFYDGVLYITDTNNNKIKTMLL
jgi:hypothetical protein